MQAIAKNERLIDNYAWSITAIIFLGIFLRWGRMTKDSILMVEVLPEQVSVDIVKKQTQMHGNVQK